MTKIQKSQEFTLLWALQNLISGENSVRVLMKVSSADFVRHSSLQESEYKQSHSDIHRITGNGFPSSDFTIRTLYIISQPHELILYLQEFHSILEAVRS